MRIYKKTALAVIEAIHESARNTIGSLDRRGHAGRLFHKMRPRDLASLVANLQDPESQADSFRYTSLSMDDRNVLCGYSKGQLESLVEAIRNIDQLQAARKLVEGCGDNLIDITGILSAAPAEGQETRASTETCRPYQQKISLPPWRLSTSGEPIDPLPGQVPHTCPRCKGTTTDKKVHPAAFPSDIYCPTCLGAGVLWGPDAPEA